MGEHHAADRGRRGHGEGLGEPHAGLLGAQQVEQRPLERVVRAGRVAERGPDAPEPLGVQVLDGLVRVGLEPLAAGLPVGVLGEGLGEPVGQRLHHDRLVVVERGLELLRHVLGAVDGHRERAEVVPGGRHVVGEAAVGPPLRLDRLLAQHRQPHVTAVG